MPTLPAGMTEIPSVAPMIRGVDGGGWVSTTDMAGHARRIERIEHIFRAVLMRGQAQGQAQAQAQGQEAQQHDCGWIVNVTQDSRLIVEHLSQLVRTYPILRSTMVVGSVHYPAVKDYWRALNPDALTFMTYAESVRVLTLDALGLFPFCKLPTNSLFLLPWKIGHGYPAVSWLDRMLLKVGQPFRRQLVESLRDRGIPVGFVVQAEDVDHALGARPNFLLTTSPRSLHSYVKTPYMRGVEAA